ncbi:MAG: psd [Peptococcaceae bacterium]|jgi:phosphatidylserine decarboxylase|nr:psd [Peptococcaceae bacterium]
MVQDLRGINFNFYFNGSVKDGKMKANYREERNRALDKRKWIIVPDAMPMLALGIALTLIIYFWLGFPWAFIPFLFVIFTLYFFRNPERCVECKTEDVVSPADGVILAVEEVREDRFLNGPAVKVSIFLNIFNVHVNRSPIAGKVAYVFYQAGKFLPAFKGHASHLNERNYVGIVSENNPRNRVLVVQITGFIARRIVCWVKEGEVLQQGERFGLIKFGSCTEVYLPKGSHIFVQKGQKVRGGETIIGRFYNE